MLNIDINRKKYYCTICEENHFFDSQIGIEHITKKQKLVFSYQKEQKDPNAYFPIKKISANIDDAFDLSSFEEILSDEGIGVGFFPNELIGKGYSNRMFLKDYFATLLGGYDDEIKHLYVSFTGSGYFVKCYFYALNKDDITNEIEKKITSIFNPNIDFPVHISFHYTKPV